MNCVNCADKVCRSQQTSCGREIFDKSDLITQYLDSSNQEIVKAAALLVDNGKAGSLSRLDEIIEYAKTMKYSKLGLAYCYGLEKTTKAFHTILTGKGFHVLAIACTVGGLKQSEVNSLSCINKISCNPLGQALQLNAENVDLTLIVGICLGHDIILQRNLKMDFTTLVVKDRVNNNNPVLALKKSLINADYNGKWIILLSHPADYTPVCTSEFNTHLLGQIPLIMEIGEAAEKGVSVYNQYDKTAVSAFEKIVELITTSKIQFSYIHIMNICVENLLFLGIYCITL